MRTFDAAIIGAGSSGIMAAITAAKNNNSVILIEKNPIIGRKILSTGNGRCNLTNKNINITRYHSTDKDFVAKIFQQFDQYKTMEFFELLGVVLKEEENGRIFPRTNQASTIVNSLEFELKGLDVEIKTNACVKNITRKQAWQITLAEGNVIFSKKLILATGGKAAHQLGSTGDGIYWAKQYGHEILPLFPALVPLETPEKWPQEIQGLKIYADVKVMSSKKIISQNNGDLLFTHFGLSGPAIMSQARFIAPYVGKEDVEIHIDAYPELSAPDLDQKIKSIFDQNGAKTVKNALAGLLPLNLISVILKIINLDHNTKAAQISKETRVAIVSNVKDMILHVHALRPFKEAQVTRGGISLNDLKDNLESKKISTLFFCGEIVDVDADSGGFNLQWAWSSGYVAGKSV